MQTISVKKSFRTHSSFEAHALTEEETLKPFFYKFTEIVSKTCAKEPQKNNFIAFGSKDFCNHNFVVTHIN